MLRTTFTSRRRVQAALMTVCFALLVGAIPGGMPAWASSHEEAPNRTDDPQPISERLDVVWRTSTSGQVLDADLRWPTGASSKLPVVILVHGGVRVGDEDKMADQATGLAQLGYFTMSTDYTLKSTKNDYLKYALKDLYAAVTWVGKRPLADPNRIGMLGSSSGGGLVSKLALFDGRLKAIVSWSGTAGDPPPEPRVKPAPRWAALSTQDSMISMDTENESQQTWIDAGSPTFLYTTDQQCHGNCFWTFVDPNTLTTTARQDAIAWLNQYLRS